MIVLLPLPLTTMPMKPPAGTSKLTFFTTRLVPSPKRKSTDWKITSPATGGGLIKLVIRAPPLERQQRHSNVQLAGLHPGIFANLVAEINQWSHHVARNDSKGNKLTNGELALDNQKSTYPKISETA